MRAVVDRYRGEQIEYYALKVVGRGLFLVLILMVGFLFVLARVTDVIAGENEIVVPTLQVSSSVDLGSLVATTFSRVSGAVVSASAIVILIGSALLTGHALRQGSAAALGRGASVARLLQPGTLGTALVISAVVMATWIVALGTAIRRRAWEALLGLPADDVPVNLGKVVAVVLAIAVVAGLIGLYARHLARARLDLRQWLVALLTAVIVIGANFLLLYTYVGALVNLQASTGVIFVMTLLLWANIVVRAYFVGLCWISALAE